MMKVVIISAPVTKSPKGITCSFVFDEAYRLAKRGLDVHIVRSFQEAESFSYGVHFHGLESSSRIKYLPFLFRHLNAISSLGYLMPPWTLLSLFKYAHAVANVASSQNVDLIHAHFAYPEGLVGLLAKKITRKPLIVTLHGYDILTEPDVNFGLRLSKRYDAIIRHVIRGADAIIVNSSAVYSEALKCGASKGKLHLIPLGVDLERFNPAISSQELKKELQIEYKRIVFTLKTHEPRYRIEDVIRAASFVLKRRKDVGFLIGGRGSLKPYHENLSKSLGVSSHVMFLGKIPYEKLPFFYSVCDVFVNPALGEGFGIVTAEAMATGKPVIAVRRYGSIDLVSDHVNGFLVNPRDAKQIAEKILWLISNSKKAKRMGVNGREIAEEKFNVNKRIDKIVQLYERL